MNMHKSVAGYEQHNTLTDGITKMVLNNYVLTITTYMWKVQLINLSILTNINNLYTLYVRTVACFDC